MVFSIASSVSQPVFKKMYGTFSINNYELKELNQSNRFILSNHNIINSKHSFFKVDEMGEPYNQAYIYQPVGGSTTGSHKFYFRNDSVYDLIGLHATMITTYPAVAFVSRRDSSLQNSYFSKFYEYRPSGPGIVSCLNFDSSYSIAGGYAIVPGQYYPMVFKLDIGLNVSWSQSYRDRIGYVQEILQASNGGWYLLMHLVNEGMSLAKTDSLGNIIWCRNYQQPFRYVSNMVQLQDGNLLLTGYKNPSGTGYAPVEIFLTKVDTSGQIIWSKTYGDSQNSFYKAGQNPTFYVDTARNHSIILTGIFKRQFHTYTDLVGALVDSSGNFIWSRCYGNDYFDEFGSICHQASDGGFILGGYNNYQINNFPPVQNKANVTVIKTDSLGVSDGCMEYPVTISVQPDTPLVTNLTWSIYVDSIVTEIPSNMVDTTGTPTRNEDMCTFVSLLELPDKQPDFEIFPNPSNGNFHIKLNSNTNIKFMKIEILDLIGRIVFTYNTTTGNQINLSIPNIAPGIYLINLTLDDTILTKKIAIE